MITFRMNKICKFVRRCLLSAWPLSLQTRTRPAAQAAHLLSFFPWLFSMNANWTILPFSLCLQFTSGSSLSEDGAFMITSSIIVVLFSTVVRQLMSKVTSRMSEHDWIHSTLLNSVSTDRYLVQWRGLNYRQCSHSTWHHTTLNEAAASSLEDIRHSLLEHGNSRGEDEWENRHGSREVSLPLLMMHPISTIHHIWQKFDDRFHEACVRWGVVLRRAFLVRQNLTIQITTSMTMKSCNLICCHLILSAVSFWECLMDCF